MSKIDNRTRYETRIFRALAHETKKRQQNRKTRNSFFCFFSIPLSLSPSLFFYSYRFTVFVKQRIRARLRVLFYLLVRNIKITGSLFQTVSNYLRSICRVTLRNFNDMFATDPLVKPRCVLCIFNVSDIYNDSCEN